jgi:hypothetical protein
VADTIGTRLVTPHSSSADAAIRQRLLNTGKDAEKQLKALVSKHMQFSGAFADYDNMNT